MVGLGANISFPEHNFATVRNIFYGTWQHYRTDQCKNDIFLQTWNHLPSFPPPHPPLPHLHFTKEGCYVKPKVW